VTHVTHDVVAGWRLWHVRLHEGERRLESFTWHHVTWPAQQALVATCPVHGQNAPASGHDCGIYSFRTRALAEDLLRRYTGVRQCYGRQPPEPAPPPPGRPIALGRVSLWGRILVREHGFRAQFAYPYELFLIGGDEAMARDLRRLYAVDVFAD
jgi:hypothetical protein